MAAHTVGITASLALRGKSTRYLFVVAVSSSLSTRWQPASVEIGEFIPGRTFWPGSATRAWKVKWRTIHAVHCVRAFEFQGDLTDDD